MLLVPRIAVKIPSSGGSNFVLDLLTPAALAAYSLRKLRSAYAGSACRILRTSDSTQQDIGFTGGGDFDSTAATTFTGASTGRVVKWYDQSGNGYDVTASDSSVMTLINAGTIQTAGPNSKPAINSTGSWFASSATVNLSNATDLTVSALIKISANNSYDRIAAIYGSGQTLDYNNTTSIVALYEPSDITIIATIGGSGSLSQSQQTIGSGTFSRIACLVNSTTQTTYVGGTGGTTNSISAYAFGSSSTVYVVGDPLGSVNAYVPEVIFHNAALSSGDRTTLWGDQQTYYGA